jgi:hypothetical protein
MDLRRDTGAVLPIVLVFAVFAIIVASVYTTGQLTIAKPSLRGPASFQALCNARSGIWKGLEMLSKKPADTLALINTLDSMFHKNLFGKQTTAIAGDSSLAIVPDDTPLVVQPFSTDSFGDCALSLTFAPCYRVLASKGRFRDIVKTAKAFLGGKVFSSSDTVCYILKGALPEGGGMIDGKKFFPAQEGALQPLVSRQPGRGAAIVQQPAEQLRTRELAMLVAYYRSKLGAKTDTVLAASPLLLQNSDQLPGLPEVINGPLFINSSFNTFAWKEKRHVYVLGDVQITGKAYIEDVEFVTSGDFKCFDEARLVNVSVFCLKQLVIGDEASFSGNALTLSSFLVYKNGRVENKSVIVAYGENKGISAEPGKTPKPQQPVPVSVSLSQNAFVDGVIVACGNPGGIKTDKNTVVKGILWAQGAVCHQGTLYGILRANELIELSAIVALVKPPQPGAPPQVQKNFMTGSVRRLPGVTEYYGPFFLGIPVIARWDGG